MSTDKNNELAKLSDGDQLWVNSAWYADVKKVSDGKVTITFSTRDGVGRNKIDVELDADSVYNQGGTGKIKHVGIDADKLKQKMGNNIDSLVQMGDVTGVLESYSIEDHYTGYPKSAIMAAAISKNDNVLIEKIKNKKPLSRADLMFLVTEKTILGSKCYDWACERMSAILSAELAAGLFTESARPLPVELITGTALDKAGKNALKHLDEKPIIEVLENIDTLAMLIGVNKVDALLHKQYVLAMNEDGAASGNAGTSGMGGYTSPGMPSAPGMADGTSGSDMAVGNSGAAWKRLRGMDKGKELMDYRNSKRDMKKVKNMRKKSDAISTKGMYNVLENENLIESNEDKIRDLLSTDRPDLHSTGKITSFKNDKEFILTYHVHDADSSLPEIERELTRWVNRNLNGARIDAYSNGNDRVEITISNWSILETNESSDFVEADKQAIRTALDSNLMDMFGRITEMKITPIGGGKYNCEASFSARKDMAMKSIGMSGNLPDDIAGTMFSKHLCKMQAKCTDAKTENIGTDTWRMTFTADLSALQGNIDESAVGDWFKKAGNLISTKWDELKSLAHREVGETKIAYEILLKVLSKQEITPGEKKFLRAQSKDLGKIIGHIATKFIPLPIPLTPILMYVQKKTGASLFPQSNSHHLDEAWGGLNRKLPEKTLDELVPKSLLIALFDRYGLCVDEKENWMADIQYADDNLSITCSFVSNKLQGEIPTLLYDYFEKITQEIGAQYFEEDHQRRVIFYFDEEVHPELVIESAPPMYDRKSKNITM